MLSFPVATQPHVARRFRANCVWMNAKAFWSLAAATSSSTPRIPCALGVVRAINYRVDVNTLARVGAARLELNEIGEISVETHHRLSYFDSYSVNRITGAFIIIDPLSNETLGAGMIVDIEGKRGNARDRFLLPIDPPASGIGPLSFR